MFPATNTFPLYHFNATQQESRKIAQPAVSEHQLLSTAPTSRFNSNESSGLASNYQNEYQSPSRFFSFGSNEASPSKSGHCDRDYQGSSFGFDELSYATPIINFLQQEKKDEGSIPSHINTGSIFDPLKEDFNLDLQDAPDFEEEIDIVSVEQPQSKKKIFTIIRQEKKTTMETEMEIESEIEDVKSNPSCPLKNAPAHLFTAIKMGVEYYSDAGKDHFPSVTKELRKLSARQLEKFKLFMQGYHGKGKTFKALGKYLEENRKTPKALELLKTILIAFLRNPEDVEKWFDGSKMRNNTKENIRQNLQKLERDFLKILNEETL